MSLSQDMKNDLISIILEETFSTGITIKYSDFSLLLDEICCHLPGEEKCKDYYFISRDGKKNPSGKLYSKYKNRRSRIKQKLTQNELFEYDEDLENQTPEDSESDRIELSLKLSLNRDGDNWDLVCEKWKKTFHLRQQEAKQLDSQEFFTVWSKFAHSQSSDLIEIDFEIMYPGRSSFLFSKWETFKNKIFNFYDYNISNEACKGLLKQTKLCKKIDSQDYLISILLCAVLPSTARFKNETGKLMKRATILDSQESFVLRLTTVNDYMVQIERIICKYYTSGLTLQPFVIVVGVSDDDIEEFFLYFDKNLVKYCQDLI
ncbi:uncharacterized protein [Drosophila takahashii]|uniref:uncharacterized protein isoform X2 n=1 Tax=Drosophila takahashii TaxID=29030 RepID=UPI003898EC39